MPGGLSAEPITEPLNKRVRKQIRAEMGRERITQWELALRIGHNQTWLSYRLTGKIALTLDDVEQIAMALSVPIDLLLNLPSVPRQRRAS